MQRGQEKEEGRKGQGLLMGHAAHESLGLRPHGVVAGDGRVIVRRDPDTAVIKGIVIPERFREKETTGTVLVVHDGVPLSKGGTRPCLVRPGERVLMNKYAGTDINWRDEVLTIVREDDLYAVLEDA